jgi:type III secretion protein T
MKRDERHSVDLLSFIGQPLERLYDYLIATGFALARMTGLIMVMPVFTRMGLTGILRSATALVLALPLVPMMGAAIAGERLTVTIVAGLLFKEVVVGLAIGLVLGVPVWAAEAAGDIIDLQRGAGSASLMDPLSVDTESITATLFGLGMVALYFGSGGLYLTLRTVYDSYAIWPVANMFPIFTPAATELFVRLLDNVITMGLVLVAPIVVFMLLSDLLLGLVSRAAPHLNVFALSLSVKNLVFALLLAFYCAFLIRYMKTDLSSLLGAGNELEIIGKPPPR